MQSGSVQELEVADKIRVWERTRVAVENLDSYLADVRKFYLTVVLGIVGVAASFAPDRAPETNALMVVAISTIIVAFTLVFWALDTHYYGFVRVAAATAYRVEKDLTLVKNHWGITGELSAFAEEGSVSRGAFQCLYIFPAIFAWLALVLVTAFGYASWWPEWGRWGLLILIAALAILILFFSYVYLRKADKRVEDFRENPDKHKHP